MRQILGRRTPMIQEVVEEPTSTVQKATYAFGLLNVVIGVTGFFGPAVTGNRDGLINIRPGYLLGFVAIKGTRVSLRG